MDEQIVVGHVKNIWINVEVFNLLNFKNVNLTTG
jgi:hypothetical protein